MSGYVWEWCWDWHDSEYYGRSPETDPKGPKEGVRRAGRGGAWCFGTEHARVASREDFNPEWVGNYLGFRVVLPG